MKKFSLSIVIVCLLLILTPALIQAQGLVTCGNNITITKNSDGKTFTVNGACEICDFFNTLARIYDFIVKMIAAPLAIIAITVGAIFMLLSAGNPNIFQRGKGILYAALIGLFLVFGSWVIINTVLHILGYSGNWSSLNLSCPASSTGSSSGGQIWWRRTI